MGIEKITGSVLGALSLECFSRATTDLYASLIHDTSDYGCLWNLGVGTAAFLGAAYCIRKDWVRYKGERFI